MRLHNKVLFILVCSMAGTIAASSAYASDELDSEINNMQVQLVRKPAPPAPPPKKQNFALRRASPKVQASAPVGAPVWHKRVADNSISALPPGPPPAPANAPRALDRRAPVVEDTPYVPESQMAPSAGPQYNSYSGYDYNNTPTVKTSQNSGVMHFVRGFIADVEIKPMFNTSTLDGSARSNVVPSGVNSPVSFNGAGEVSLDLNIGMRSLLLEVGGTYLRAGAQTGDAAYAGFNNFIYQDQVTLGYAALPISAKYVFGSDPRSGLYAKAGIQPAYLLSHSYSSYSNYYDELRFGGYSQWDFMLTAGVGYSYNIGDHFQLVLDISGYQGMIPVFATMNAYNVGFTTGLGLAYRL